ncbi:MAG TPA: NAD(P)H-hydrate dehydratase [Thermoanaerobaculia bacterium]|nr:NAD(P)H-hydrate dehydratase [Thermoanaerobaculia bacterium]
MRVLTSAEMAAVDRAAQKKAKIPSRLLMERAAEGVVALGGDLFPGTRRVAVLCGPGNNGGDGLAAARLFHARGISPTIVLLAAPGHFRNDPLANWKAAREREIPWRAARDARAALAKADLVVDALFGTGLSRPLAGPARRLVEAANASGRPILAVDVPSGLSGDRGDVFGPAIRATATAAIAALKRCHVLYPARSRCGEIAVVDIGIPEALVETRAHRFATIGRDEIAPLFPPRAPDTHKGDAGRVVILAGSRGKAGAALLAALGALRGGAGLVTIACPASIERGYLARLPEAMTLPLPDEDGALGAGAAKALRPLLADADAVAAGPGIGTGEGARRAVEAVLRSGVPALFDADALNAFAGRPETFRRAAPTIVTPHPGEAGRLLGRSTRAVQADRPAAAAELSRRTRAIAMLKGAGTISASPEGNLWLNSTGSPALAKGGTGDVLAGVGAAFLAQGLEAADAAVAAAFVHGLAGEWSGAERGERGTLASEVADAVAGVLRSFE